MEQIHKHRTRSGAPFKCHFDVVTSITIIKNGKNMKNRFVLFILNGPSSCFELP